MMRSHHLLMKQLLVKCQITIQNWGSLSIDRVMGTPKLVVKVKGRMLVQFSTTIYKVNRAFYCLLGSGAGVGKSQ